MIIASIHGSEPAGSISTKRLKHFLDTNKFPWKNSRLILVPEANPCGLKLGWRHNPYIFLSTGNLSIADMNRQYEHGGTNRVNQKILELIDEYDVDMIIDLHEAWGYHTEHPDSMGNGIYPIGKKGWSIASSIKNQLNDTIKKQECQYFVKHWTPIPKGSLRQYALDNNKDYILMESSAEQSLPLRIRQQTIFLKQLLKEAFEK